MSNHKKGILTLGVSLVVLAGAGEALASSKSRPDVRDNIVRSQNYIPDGLIMAQSSADRFPTTQSPANTNRRTSRDAPSPSTSVDELPSRFKTPDTPAQNRSGQPRGTTDQNSTSNATDQARDENVTDPVDLEGPDQSQSQTVTSSDETTNPGTGAESSEELKFFDENPDVGSIFSEKEYLSKVDPDDQAGQKFVVVEKNAERGDQDALLEAARRARKFDRYEAALDFYNRLLKDNPNDSLINLERAITLQKLGRTDSALRGYDKVLDIDPDNYQARVNMLILVRQRYPSVALQKMIELYEENPDIPNLPAQIGVAYAESGDFAKAKRYLDSAISQQPNNPSHRFNMAIIYDKQGKYKEAVRAYEKALELDAIGMSSKKIPRDQIYDRLSVLRDRT